MVLPAQLNPSQFAIPLLQVPLVVVPAAEGIASSSHLSLEEEIDKFQFADERTLERIVEILDFEIESDKLSTAHQLGQTVVFVETSSKEAEIMDLKKRSSLRGLIANRGKEATPLEAPKTQTSANLPLLPPLPPVDQGPCVNPKLKKKRPLQELEEGEMPPQRGVKQQKMKDPQNKRSKSVESRDNVKVRHQQHTWALVIEMEGAPIPYDSTIRESSWGHSMYLDQALEQPLLLPKDMDALKRMRQPDLFISLKRDLAMVSTVSLAFQLISYIFFM